MRPTQHLLSAALLTLASLAAQAQEPTVSALIDGLGAATQPIKDDDWTAQRQAEAEVAGKISALIAATPGAPELTAPDARGRTPLIRATLWGYARVVEALLTDASVQASINVKDKDGLSAWMAAQYARPLTLAACHPQALAAEALPLLRPHLRRMNYFTTQSPTAFDRIRALLAAAGAAPELDAAKAYWLAQCPGHDPALAPAITASEDLMATLWKNSLPRVNAFMAELQGINKWSVSRSPLSQPVFPEGEKPVPGGPKSKHPGAPNCTQMPRPPFDGLWRYSGEVLFKVEAELQDGMVVAASIETLSSQPSFKPEALRTFRFNLYGALGGYRCPGDHLFKQEFMFKIG